MARDSDLAGGRRRWWVWWSGWRLPTPYISEGDPATVSGPNQRPAQLSPTVLTQSRSWTTRPASGTAIESRLTALSTKTARAERSLTFAAASSAAREAPTVRFSHRSAEVIAPALLLFDERRGGLSTTVPSSESQPPWTQPRPSTALRSAGGPFDVSRALLGSGQAGKPASWRLRRAGFEPPAC